MTNSSKFLAGVILGLVAGLLIAPEKGEDLREDIADTAEKLKRKLLRIADKTGAEYKDLRKMLEKEISGLGDDVRLHMLTILNETAERGNGIKKRIVKEIHS